MGNILTTPIHRDIPEAIPIDESEIKQNAKRLFERVHHRASEMDITKDPWYSSYSELSTKEKWTLRRVSSFVPGLGYALGLFGVYCLLEQIGLFDDGGWRAWTEKKDH